MTHYLDFIGSKIISKENLSPVLARLRFKEKRIVFTNGCFDILHKGHVDYLAKAKEKGDVLIIGLNTDASVQRLKGSVRPVQEESSRALLLASLFFVDYVVPFDEDTPYELIKCINPDVLVKGADYKKQDIVGYDIVDANGGAIVTIEYLEGFSTSSIIEKIKKTEIG
ncbi:MAG: D-glycero-beta-D-manno-heptose 1-phosphate adenylyltransferase [Bacteroidales bacterium]|nr:D-glycero-beta-D-manno-heptose 1-phosphate adenylyltransferase [Bacteroidales bacterium]